MLQAKGPFKVKIVPLPPDVGAQDTTLGPMSLDKQFHGDLEAVGNGQMLTAGSADGSGAYVAIERVTGTLHRRNGSFTLQHTGIMIRRPTAADRRRGPRLRHRSTGGHFRQSLNRDR